MKTQPRQHISNKYNNCTVVTSPAYIGSKHLISKIMYVIAAIYKILSVTETEFTYRDGTNTHFIVRMADY